MRRQVKNVVSAAEDLLDEFLFFPGAPPVVQVVDEDDNPVTVDESIRDAYLKLKKAVEALG